MPPQQLLAACLAFRPGAKEPIGKAHPAPWSGPSPESYCAGSKSKQVQRVGAESAVPVAVRLVAATNSDLESRSAMAASGKTSSSKADEGTSRRTSQSCAVKDGTRRARHSSRCWCASCGRRSPRPPTRAPCIHLHPAGPRGTSPHCADLPVGPCACAGQCRSALHPTRTGQDVLSSSDQSCQRSRGG